jgi:hypothetical protein
MVWGKGFWGCYGFTHSVIAALDLSPYSRERGLNKIKTPLLTQERPGR